jgi:hypothetical protein
MVSISVAEMPSDFSGRESKTIKRRRTDRRARPPRRRAHQLVVSASLIDRVYVPRLFVWLDIETSNDNRYSALTNRRSGFEEQAS